MIIPYRRKGIFKIEMKPYFSVIVPVYNVEGQLRLCVESIINQSFCDLEILLIDDGSKDSSGKICDELATQYSNIKCFHKKNGGLSDARNYGIDRASGKYLLFIDSDDVIDKDFCKVLHDAHEKYSADIVSTSLVEFYSYDELEELMKQEHIYKETLLENNEIIKRYYMPSEEVAINHGLCMKSYKVELFNELRFEPGKLHEDLYITYQLLDKCKKFVYINLPYYYYYRNNTGSITNNYSSKNFEHEIMAINNMICYFEKRADVQNELISFIAYHYLTMIQKCYNLKNPKEVLGKDNIVRSWVLSRIWGCTKISVFKKMAFLVCLNYPSIYIMLKGREK